MDYSPETYLGLEPPRPRWRTDLSKPNMIHSPHPVPISPSQERDGYSSRGSRSFSESYLNALSPASTSVTSFASPATPMGSPNIGPQASPLSPPPLLLPINRTPSPVNVGRNQPGSAVTTCTAVKSNNSYGSFKAFGDPKTAPSPMQFTSNLNQQGDQFGPHNSTAVVLPAQAGFYLPQDRSPDPFSPRSPSGSPKRRRFKRSPRRHRSKECYANPSPRYYSGDAHVSAHDRTCPYSRYNLSRCTKDNCSPSEFLKRCATTCHSCGPSCKNKCCYPYLSRRRKTTSRGCPGPYYSLEGYDEPPLQQVDMNQGYGEGQYDPRYNKKENMMNPGYYQGQMQPMDVMKQGKRFEKEPESQSAEKGNLEDRACQYSPTTRRCHPPNVPVLSLKDTSEINISVDFGGGSSHGSASTPSKHTACGTLPAYINRELPAELQHLKSETGSMNSQQMGSQQMALSAHNMSASAGRFGGPPGSGGLPKTRPMCDVSCQNSCAADRSTHCIGTETTPVQSPSLQETGTSMSRMGFNTCNRSTCHSLNSRLQMTEPLVIEQATEIFDQSNADSIHQKNFQLQNTYGQPLSARHLGSPNNQPIYSQIQGNQYLPSDFSRPGSPFSLGSGLPQSRTH